MKTSKVAPAFRIPNPYESGWRQKVMQGVVFAAEHTLGLSALQAIYRRQTWAERPSCQVAEGMLESIGVTIQFPSEQLDRIPVEGPLIVVANHPFGGLEGLALLALINRVRSDTKVLANYILHRIPELRNQFIAVDPFGGEESHSRNLSPMRDAIRHLRGGGALGVFPAGEVSQLSLWPRLAITDPPWSKTVGQLAQKTGATVICVYFHGRNSMLFQMAGLLHPRLRTLLLPRELLNRQNHPLQLRIGHAIAPTRLNKFTSASDMTAYLRVRTYLLASTFQNGKSHSPEISSPAPQPIALPESRSALRQEVDGLCEENVLLESSPYRVFVAKASQIPYTMRELGRLREISFRQIGEGTGLPRDIDCFDDDYHHLWAWDDSKNQIVGAYRLGATDEILPQRGKKGLYTYTLFRFRTALMDQLNPALEMGRSFVQPDYQKNHLSLGLLWKGIGEFLARYPRYVRLFGAVSISDNFSSMSQMLLLEYLRANHLDHDLHRFVRPKCPPHLSPLQNWSYRDFSVVVQDVKDVSELIDEIEANFQAVPVLVKQYLRLKCRFLGFNIDPVFGHSLDGLIMLDLLESPKQVIRFVGREKAEKIFAYHGRELS